MSDLWAEPDITDPAVLAEAFLAFPGAAARVATRVSGATAGAARFVPFLDRKTCADQQLYIELSLTGLRLLQRAKADGGLDRDSVLEIVGPDEIAQVDREVRVLIVAGLARLERGRLVVAPTVAPVLPLPLPLFAEDVEYITSDRLALACRLLGVDGGTRKAERAAAVLDVLRDPPRFRAALKAAGPEAEDLFRRIVGKMVGPGRTPGPVAIYDLLTREEQTDRLRFSRTAQRSTLDQLSDRCLISLAPYSGYELWLWMESARSFGVDLLGHIPTEPELELVTVDDPATAPARVVAALHALLGFMASNPVEGKKSGDRRPPVRYWRSAAKAVGIPTPLGEVLGEVAADLGLLYAALLPVRGRGRTAEHPVEWRVNPRRVQEIEAWGPATTWLAIVEQWLLGSASANDESVIQRELVWSFLAALPAGSGSPRGRLERAAYHRHLGLVNAAVVASVIDTMVLLGVATNSPGVGLTAAARAASAGVDGVEAVLDGGSHTFVVQPDHSIVAPPDLAPALTAELARYADVVSEGGATVWRLSASRLARAAHQLSVDDVLGFLERHAHSSVPDAVRRYVADAMVAGAPVVAIDAGCVITSTDPVVVADAARHKAAKLTVVAPGVAVSTLPRAKVTAVLAEKGIRLAGISPAGSADPGPSGASVASGPTRISDAAPSWAVPQSDPNSPLREPGRIAVRTDSPFALAEAVTGRDGTDGRNR